MTEAINALFAAITGAEDAPEITDAFVGLVKAILDIVAGIIKADAGVEADA